MVNVQRWFNFDYATLHYRLNLAYKLTLILYLVKTWYKNGERATLIQFGLCNVTFPFTCNIQINVDFLFSKNLI